MTGALRAALAAAFLLSAWLIWGFDPLPSADLPQHAAQLALFRELHDPAFPYAAQYELNPFTPYLLAYLVAGIFSLLLPVGLAFKAALQLALIGWVWAAWRFQRRVGGDPWWTLFAFPLFFGFSFLWGFLNYLLAVPLVLLVVELFHAYGERPRRAAGLRLAAVGVALFFAHGMACVFGMALGAAVALVRSGAGGIRPLLRIAAPCLPAALLTLAWRLLNPEFGLEVRWRSWDQQLSLFRRVLGGPLDDQAAAFSLAILLLALAALLAGRQELADLPAREAWARRLPLLFALAYVLAMPDRLGSLYHANGRFLLFLPLFAGWWLAGRPEPRWRRPLPALVAALSIGWLLVLLVRFGAVERNLAGVLPLLDQLPERGRLLYVRLGEDRSSFEMPFGIHQGAWYTVRRRGVADFSFAAFSTELVRYVPGRQPALPIGFEHRPWVVDVMALTGHYDFWLVYAPDGAAATLPPDRFRLRGRNGPWWTYEIVQPPDTLPPAAIIPARP